MSVPLLQTKLFVPQLRPGDIVSRPQLSMEIQWRSGQKLTLVSAPAGFGKTTLIAAWLAELQTADHPADPPHAAAQLRATDQPRCAWLALDENDNETSRFLAYWVAAIQRADVSLGQEAKAMLEVPGPPSATNLFTSLLNELSDYPHPLIIVLDDYHVIQEAPLHNAIAFWLDYAPNHCHLVLTTRTEPPLPLALLRSRGQVNEIRADDLRFSAEEIAHFFQQVMDIDLSNANTHALANRTEGWIAGLKMAGLSMRGCDDIPAFIERFSGSHRFIIDYLADQVLDRCSDVLRAFLLQTSVLARMCAPLVDALLPDLATAHTRDSQSILEELEAANLFIVPLDDERHWYRYHHLFGELLQHRLRRVYPELETTLHERASAWYEEAGYTYEAIEHALTAANYVHAADLMESVQNRVSLKGELRTFARWAEALPHELVIRRHRIALYYVMFLSFVNRNDEVENYFNAVDRAVEIHPGDVELQKTHTDLTFLRCVKLATFGNFAKSIELARKTEQIALSYVSAAASFGTLLSKGQAAIWWWGDVEMAHQVLAEVFKVARSTQFRREHSGRDVVGHCLLANLHLLQGELGAARRVAEQSLQNAHTPEGVRQFGVIYPLGILGRIHYERNDLDLAADFLSPLFEQSRNISSGTTNPLDTTLALAFFKQAHGEGVAALKAVDDTEQHFQQLPISSAFRTCLTAIRARLWLRQRNLSAATAWADELSMPAVGDEIRPIHVFPYLTWVRVRLAQQDFAAIDDFLAQLLAWSQDKTLHSFVLEIALLQALSQSAQDRLDSALRHLAQALELAAPAGYMRTFIDESEAMRKLLRHAASRGLATTYVLKLLAAMEETTRDAKSSVSQPNGNAALIEPLSPRELEVLQLIDTGHTNQQIAHKLIIALSTVKRHINNIYGKLNAQNRTHALARARELKLF
ncbi:LuxR C-terminal-related transcriptional regulator [Chloroflexi bacterium TSY]|nr:LuxR C-terminal-related transcriptional regulator [Chloroflexi bacterium TSY]